MLLDHPSDGLTAIRTHIGAIFVSLELSRSNWLVTSLPPGKRDLRIPRLLVSFECSRQDNGRRRCCRSRAPSFGRHPLYCLFCMESRPQAARLAIVCRSLVWLPVTLGAACPRRPQ